jgi:NAD(P)-dependent dehydrogenase (short-subunit alcohol dehydrogenase family)
MTDEAKAAPVAVICGSDTLVGGTLTTRLRESGWHVVAADAPGARSAATASEVVRGEIGGERYWLELSGSLRTAGAMPELFVHAQSGFRSIGGRTEPADDDALALTLRSAELGCRYLMPLMPRDRGSVVILASVLAGWDVQPDALFGATQAGLLGLVRSEALRGGADGLRVNAVCMGLVAEPEIAASLPESVRHRIPLGGPASPDDVVDSVLFLQSPDARHISGSALVVDGGQSLQSWSNAPREGGYPPPPFRDGVPLTAQNRFQDRVVLITGAAGGLGSAATRRFASEGARLALVDRDETAARLLADELGTQGSDCLPLVADAADEGSVAAAFSHAEAHFGRLDVVFNNAGIGGLDLAVADTPAERWDETIAVNLRGVFLGSKHAVPALRRAGGGAIVNMGSSTGRHDTISGGAYMASKAAVEAMTKALALQVARFGIRANTICPGIIETSLSFRQQERGGRDQFFAEFARRIPLGRVGQPEDVAAAVAYLASDQARHITGASLLIDGGQTMRRWISAPDLDWTEFAWEGLSS